MTRRQLRRVAGALVAFLAGGVLAACGVPAETGVRVDGPVPEAGSSGGGGPANPPRGPDEADNETQLVEYFLQAAAGNPENPMEALREFIHPDQRAAWEPDPQVLVVRTVGDSVRTPGDQTSVELKVEKVGVLTENDEIRPQAGPASEVTFMVAAESDVTTAPDDRGLDVGDPRYRLVEPLPEEIMLSQSALQEYLVPRPLYFWSGDQDVLVPDLRWLPSALPDRQRAQKVLEWLEDGPSPWLQDAVDGLPDDVALAGNAVWEGDRLDVPLTAAAGDVDPTALDAQLWWTLRPELAGGHTLVLVIDGQERAVDQEYLAQNPAARPVPASFVVLDGVIYQQRAAGDRLAELPALAGDVNADIHSAALTREGGRAALVRVEPDGRHRLVISRPAGLEETGLVRDDIHRPVWLNSGRGGLVAADGRLHRFTSEGETTQLDVGGLEGISAVAAAPDGRRIALVAGGELYVAPMLWLDEAFTVGTPRQLSTTPDDISGVGFLREDWLAVVGRAGGESLLYEITVDGALEQELPSGRLGDPPSVGNFVAYPADPMEDEIPGDITEAARGDIMYETGDGGGQAWRYAYHGRGPAQIMASDLYGIPSGAEGEEDPGDPRAPFFMDY